MRYPLVRDLAADGMPAAVTCRVLGFSKQAFYSWRRNPVSHRDWQDANLINAALDIHHDDPAFGYRFIADELRAACMDAGDNRGPGPQTEASTKPGPIQRPLGAARSRPPVGGKSAAGGQAGPAARGPD